MKEELSNKELQDEIDVLQARLRHTKRLNSFQALQNIMNKSNLQYDQLPIEQIEHILSACYDFIAQHRAMFKTHKFVTDKQLRKQHKKDTNKL